MARPDPAHKETDELLVNLEARIASVYKAARDDLQKTVENYFESFKARDEMMKKAVDEGKVTADHYRQWRMNQIARGKRFEALRDKMARRYTQANETAVAYVNDATPGIYSLNRNYTAYTIDRATGGAMTVGTDGESLNADFVLFDEQTVKRLIVESPDVMPYYPPARAVQRGIDLDYGKRQISANVTSGILRGLDINQMANELQARISSMERASAIRAARTAVTTAQNAGRQDSFDAAANMGIHVRKRWIAFKDMRTRQAHGEADGQIVEEDKPFNVGGYKMMFPGDQSGGAPGWLIYNCRCTLGTAEKDGIEAEARQERVRNPITGEYELVSDMTYKEWYAAQVARYGKKALDIAMKKVHNETQDRKLYEQYQEEFGKNVPKTFKSFQTLKYDSGDWEQYKDYTTALRKGELSALADFTLYKDTSREIDRKLVGLVTKDGISVTGKSKHFISRVIGSVEQRRNGVVIEDVKKAILSPTEIRERGDSHQYILESVCDVSINPQTGNLIQTNPRHSKK